MKNHEKMWSEELLVFALNGEGAGPVPLRGRVLTLYQKSLKEMMESCLMGFLTASLRVWEWLERFWSRQQDESGLLWNLIGMNGAWCSFSLLPVSFNLLLLWRIRFSSLISKTNESRLLRRWRAQGAERGRGGAYKSTCCDEVTLVWRTHLIRFISLIFLIL